MIDFDQQERWLRVRAARNLDPAVAGFASGGLLDNLDGTTIAVVVLPADVLAQPIDFSDDLPGAVLPERFSGLTANGVGLLSNVTTTSTALIRFAPGGDAKWRAFVAIDRSGGITGAMGTTARYQLDRGRHAATWALRLFMLAHLVRVVIRAQANLLRWAATQSPAVTIGGPFEIVVAVPDTQGMVLAGLNEGWEPPDQDFDPPRAKEPNVTVRLQVEEWPDSEDELETLTFRLLARVGEAFGDRDQRYRPARGLDVGKMAPGYA